MSEATAIKQWKKDQRKTRWKHKQQKKKENDEKFARLADWCAQAHEAEQDDMDLERELEAVWDAQVAQEARDRVAWAVWLGLDPSIVKNESA